MSVEHVAEGTGNHWSLDQVDFGHIDKTLVQDDHFLFQTLASASFVEILSETYADNLIQYFHGEPDIIAWLQSHWKRDEVQHCTALKTYIKTAWPAFDWDSAYLGFTVEYGVLCTVENLEKNKPLELMARCVVETGTSSFYRALQNYVREPVLKGLLGRIKGDETAHYAHFRRAFDVCNKNEPQSILALVATIFRRLSAIGGEDAFIAFKHAQAQQDDLALNTAWQKYHKQLKQLARAHYPYAVAVKMLIRPMPLFRPVKALLQWPLVGVAYLFSLA